MGMVLPSEEPGYLRGLMRQFLAQAVDLAYGDWTYAERDILIDRLLAVLTETPRPALPAQSSRAKPKPMAIAAGTEYFLP